MKVLAALSRFPWPLEKGDKLRAYYQLQGLAQHHEVHLLCLSEHVVEPAALKMLDFCASVTVVHQPRWRSALNLGLGLLDGKPFQVHYFHSKRMRRVFGELIARHGIERVYVQLLRLGMNLPEGGPQGWFLDYMDTFSIGMGARAEKSGGLGAWAARMEARRLKRYEAEIASRFGGLSVISTRDAEGLPESARARVHVIPNGVGEQFFEALPPAEEMAHDLVFFGNMGYEPNVQSVHYLMDEIVPALKALGIDPRICLAGARPSASVLAYAGPRVTVTGFVDDIRVPILRSRLAIAPVIAGQGMQNKLLESMAMGLPTLTTPMAHAGVPARDGVELVVCDSPRAFAEAIRDLLAHPEKAAAIGQAGRRFVAANYRWAEMNHRLDQALRGC